MFSNTVVSRSSYTFNELIVGAKFQMMYHRNPQSNKTTLDFEKLSSYTEYDIDYAFTTEKNVASG